jgi:nitrite reductase (NO-forming)
VTVPQARPGSDEQRGEPREPPPLTRRAVLKRAGIGGAAVLGGGLLAHELIPRTDDTSYAAAGHADAHAGAAGHTYGHATLPPPGLGEQALEAVTVPPPFDGRRGVTRSFDLPVTERQLVVGDGVVADAWTYAGSVPGPILRATEGDLVAVRLDNRTAHPHNLHLHGRHAPEMDGWEPIPPGSGFTYEVVAEPFGLHPYHCHVAPIAEHIGRGLYGTMIVDPPGGRPPAHEFVLVLGGWDLDGDGRNELVCWNGVAGFFATYPLKVPVGELVRVYLVNMLEHEPLASFHLHAQTFDVYATGTSLEPDGHTDVVTLSQGERAIVEFRLLRPGRYMFHPHQSWLADRGAMGWFAAI